MKKGLRDKESRCEPCSVQTYQGVCTKKGCLWTKAIRKKPAVCESCADQKESNCLKKDCILVKKSDCPDKVCTSCASLSGKSGTCLTAKCAYEKKSKGYAPCSTLKKSRFCQKMKSCLWKPGKGGKPGQCGKVKGKVAITCCDLYEKGTTAFENCCKSGIYGVCPLECPGFT